MQRMPAPRGAVRATDRPAGSRSPPRISARGGSSRVRGTPPAGPARRIGRGGSVRYAPDVPRRSSKRASLFDPGGRNGAGDGSAGRHRLPRRLRAIARLILRPRRPALLLGLLPRLAHPLSFLSCLMVIRFGHALSVIALPTRPLRPRCPATLLHYRRRGREMRGVPCRPAILRAPPARHQLQRLVAAAVVHPAGGRPLRSRTAGLDRRMP